MKAIALAIALLTASAASAQQSPPPDSAFLQRVIAAMQQQRNAAFDGQVVAEARAAMLADEVAALKAKVEELQKAAAPK